VPGNAYKHKDSGEIINKENGNWVVTRKDGSKGSMGNGADYYHHENLDKAMKDVHDRHVNLQAEIKESADKKNGLHQLGQIPSAKQREGASVHQPGELSNHGFFSYKTSPDVMRTEDGHFYAEMRNGGISIHVGPLSDTPNGALKAGKIDMEKENPIAAKNIYGSGTKNERPRH
jgi:hypothetical protein